MADSGIELSATRQRSADITTMGSPAQSSDNNTAAQRDVGSLEEPEIERGKIQVFAIMVALCLSLFIAALDQTIVSTSLPTIASRLHSASGYTWVGGAYLLASAAAAPIWAKLSDIWGRKPILLVAVLWFLLSSIVCAAAVNMKMLIAGRALQGIAGGGLLQLVMIVVSDLFSVRSRSLYMGILEFMWTISGGLGPILGGVFSEYVSWRWNFWINLPICGLAFILLFFYLDVHNPKTKVTDGLKAIDWLGSLSIIGFTLMVLLGLNFGGETFAWNSPQVICLIVFGSLFSIIFFCGEKYVAKYPLMPLKILKHRSNIAVSLVTLFHGAVFIACEYWLPLYFQSAKQASPMRSGLMVLPLVVAEGLFSGISGWLIHRTGRYAEQIWIGTVLLTLGTGLFIRLNPASPLVELIIFQVIGGAGSAILFAPPLIALQAMVAQDDTASATAMLGFIRTIAMSVSIVVGGVVFQNSMAGERSRLKSAGLMDEIVEELTGASAAASTEVIKTLNDPSKIRTVASAFSSSLQNMWIMYTCMAGVAVLASAFIVNQPLSEEHTETRTGLKEE
ncbi:major facilitator superfamily domain-containing protein [Aspergillus pseudonomiae]|uniref:Major facilitator superfamily domain-containing protein n=1 Tax=Aspergillus pseudonomiae TaxID=1506151 RepID=A0A5N7D106_9EURO|nr:major facilitator superfamily domain-containing protein [Aspergillus pseudonomiae]KAB8261437.1 major facilitator superfamily domain-containing protein [Aspergillus pseudonomiae]KAE8400101.1 major facilitator superfamily domain-containing protein [Aspergillus pseudonomiae]